MVISGLEPSVGFRCCESVGGASEGVDGTILDQVGGWIRVSQYALHTGYPR